VLEAGHLHPRLDLLEIQAQRPRGLQHPEREHALLADARLLRVQLGEALGGGGLETHPLLGHHQQRAAMLPRFAQHQLRHPPAPGRFDARPRQTHGKLLPAFGLAGQMQGNHPAGVGFEFGPMAQRRSADGLDFEPFRQDKAEPENPRPRDVHDEIGCQHRPIFAQRKGVLRLHPHIRLDGRSLERSSRRGIAMAEGAAHGQTRNARLQDAGGRGREIFEVDRRPGRGADAIELHFVAGGDAHQTNLSRRALDPQQPDGLLEGKRAAGQLRADQQREGAGLSRLEGDPQPAGVGIEAPEGDGCGRDGLNPVALAGRGDQARGVRDVNDGDAAWDGENQLGQFTLRGADRNLVDPFDHPRRRHIELNQLGIENRRLALHIAAPRLPADPHLARRRQHQPGHRVAPHPLALQRNRLRRENLHVPIGDRQFEAVDQTVGNRQPKAGLALALAGPNLVGQFNLEGAAFAGGHLVRPA